MQAGVGISIASGTGPIPVITNSSTDLITTAGDILYGTAADTVARLGIGAAGRVLKVNSGATAPEWAVDPTTDVVTTAGDLIYGTGADAVTRLGIGTAGQVLKVNSGATAPEWGAAGGSITSAAARVETDQDTTSTSYTDLTTSGPAVTLTTGTKVLVIIGCFHYADTTDKYAYASYAISGATTSAASDDFAVSTRMINAAFNASAASVASVRTVTAGSNTFTMKYKTTTGANAHFINRQIIVIDLGS